MVTLHNPYAPIRRIHGYRCVAPAIDRLAHLNLALATHFDQLVTHQPDRTAVRIIGDVDSDEGIRGDFVALLVEDDGFTVIKTWSACDPQVTRLSIDRQRAGINTLNLPQ